MKYKGIDISQWEENLNYKTMVKELDFVVIREGYRKTRDKQFLNHVNGFRNAGIKEIQVFHFLYPLNKEDPKLEAQSCIKNV